MGDVHVALIGIPARVDELECNVYNRVVFQELTAKEPVPAMEAFQVRTDVVDLAVPVSDICPIADSRFLSSSS